MVVVIIQLLQFNYQSDTSIQLSIRYFNSIINQTVYVVSF